MKSVALYCNMATLGDKSVASALQNILRSCYKHALGLQNYIYSACVRVCGCVC